MKKFKFLCFLLSVSFICIQCSKEEVPPYIPEPLPPHFRMEIDGMSWTSKIQYIMAIQGVDKIDFMAYGFQPNNHVSMSIHSDIELRTYSLNGFQDEVSFLLYDGTTLQRAVSGQLFITRISEDGKTVDGAFSFELEEGQHSKIEKGEFRLHK